MFRPPLALMRKRSLLNSITSLVLCSWVAVAIALIAEIWWHPIALLMVFVVVPGFVARACNLMGAILGLAAAAWVFCVGLLPPIGRIEVSSPTARMALFWMLALGLVAAYVFARPRGSGRVTHSASKSR